MGCSIFSFAVISAMAPVRQTLPHIIRLVYLSPAINMAKNVYRITGALKADVANVVRKGAHAIRIQNDRIGLKRLKLFQKNPIF